MPKKSFAETYATLSAQKRDLEAKMDEIKEATIREIYESKEFDRSAPFISTSYGRLIACTKSRYVYDEPTLEKVKVLKNEIRAVEDEAAATGKATLEMSQYLTLKA